jgi:hypothetical protein
MLNRIVVSLLVLVFLAVAPAARGDLSLNVEGFAGSQNLQPSRQSLGNAVGGREGTAIMGAGALLDLGGLAVGVALDNTVSGTAQPWAGSLTGGFLFDFPLVRIEALGEVGRRGRDFGNLFDSGGALFLGLRPGASIRVAASPFRLGLNGLVRWPTSNGDIGSPDFGIVGKIGFELP